MTTRVKLLRAFLSASVLSLAMLMTVSAAGTGTITEGPLRMRSEPNTSSSILASVPAGTTVDLLSGLTDGWYQVSYSGLTGYMSGDYISAADPQQYAYINTGSSTLNLRSDPSTDGSVLASLPGGTTVEIEDTDDNGWYRVTYQGVTGYICNSYVVVTDDSSAVSAASSVGQQVVDYAKQFLGCSYVYGSSGPTCFDCSGFTSYIYQTFGVSLNRCAADQLQNGVAVDRSDLRAGDLVFFRYQTTKAASHVGIFIGNNQFIHASTNTYSVIISDLSGHYADVFVGGRRVL